MPLYALLLLVMGASLGARTLGRRTTQGVRIPVWDQYCRGDAMTSQNSRCCIRIRAPLFESNYIETTTINYMNKDVKPQSFMHYTAMNCTLSLSRASGCSKGRMNPAVVARSPQTTLNDYAAKIRQYSENYMVPLRIVAEMMDASLLNQERQGIDSSEESVVELKPDALLITIASSDIRWFNGKTTLNSSNILCSGTFGGIRKLVTRCLHLRQSNHICAETGIKLRLKTCQLPTPNMCDGVQNIPEDGAPVSGSKFDTKCVDIVPKPGYECPITCEFAPMERILWTPTRRQKGCRRSSKEIIIFSSATPRDTDLNSKQTLQAPLSSRPLTKSLDRCFQRLLQSPHPNSQSFEDTVFDRGCDEESTTGVTLTVLTIGSLLFFCIFISFSNVAGPNSLDDWDKVMQQVLCQVIVPNYVKPKRRRLLRQVLSPQRSSVFQLLLLSVTAVYLFTRPMQAAQDLRGSIINGMEPCFHYTMDQSLFRMNCSVLHWQTQGYRSDTYISLSASETFDGGGTPDNEESYIDLTGITDFEGLFTVKDVEVTTFAKAPVIRNVHVRNGTTAEKGGFIVQKEQKYFIIDSCSSSGNITNTRAGGICGYKCGFNNGEIKIGNSYSTGKIKGNNAGGITGEMVGYNGGIVHITQCYSTGNIEGRFAGGICGYGAGREDGQVYIKQSYSTGDIVSGADKSGGILGLSAGHTKGYVKIQECYSSGQISADYSGGIVGAYAADHEGEVCIIDCYTRGAIDGNNAGGIAGLHTGGCCSKIEYFGDVNITNTYASGTVNHKYAGGILGRIHSGFEAHTVHVKYSVYSSDVEGKIIGQDEGNHLDETGDSNDLTTIRGELYHYGGVQRWHDDTWVMNGTDILPILRFQIPAPSPSPTSARTPTTTRSTTTTTSRTPSPTVTKSPTDPSRTQTPSPTATISETSSLTATATPTETKSPTISTTQTPSSTATKSKSSSLTATATPTETKSPSVSTMPTLLPTATTSETSSRTGTVTPTKMWTTTTSTIQTPSPTKEAAPTLTEFRGDSFSKRNVMTCVKVVQKLVRGGGRTIKLPVQEVKCQEKR